MSGKRPEAIYDQAPKFRWPPSLQLCDHILGSWVTSPHLWSFMCVVTERGEYATNVGTAVVCSDASEPFCLFVCLF